MKKYMVCLTCFVVGTFPVEGAFAQAAPSAGRAFAAEAAGGVAGSLAGAAVGLAISRPDRCGSDDLECIIRGLGAAGIGSTIGAPIGTLLLGNAVKSRPSAAGAILGSIAGAFAGAGLVHALTEEVNLRIERPMTIVVYSVTQGLLTAVGSRIGASLR